MQRKFLVNIGLLIFANLLVKPFWIFGIDREVQNIVGAEDYGLFFAVFNFTFLFQTISDLGINHFNVQSASADPGLIKSRFSKFLQMKVIFGLIYFLFCFSLGLLLGYDMTQMHMLKFLAINQVLNTLILYLRSNFSAKHWFKVDTFFSVLDRLILIGICGFFIWSFQLRSYFNIYYFVYAQTIALAITFILIFLISLFVIRPKWNSISWEFSRDTLQKSLGFALLFVLMTAYQRTDAVMLELLLPESGNYQAGVYAAAYRLLDAFAMVAFLFSTILLPMFSRFIAEGKDFSALLSMSTKLLLSYSIILTVSALFFHQEIMDVLYVQSNETWGTVFLFVIAALNGIVIMYPFGSLLTANRNLKELNAIALVGFLLNVVLNVILIPKKQAMGAAIATLVTQAYVALAHLLVCRKVFGLPIATRLVLRIVAFVVICYSLFFACSHLPLSWFIQLLIGIISSAILAFVMKLIDLQQLGIQVKQRVEEKM